MTAGLATSRVVDPRIGVVLEGRYRIVRKIGQGGVGSVYEAEHLAIKRRLAVKVLHPQLAGDRELVQRFRREAQAASAIGHPHIVEVTDMGTLDDGAPYMVLEYLDGRDWRADLDAQGAQPLGKTVRIVGQICDALGAAHAKGIIHRDLKPENVFLIHRDDDPDYVKVLDFGVSKFADADEHKSLTATGSTLGTPYFMSPEQCRGEKDIDHRTDIYSLGVVLFRALTQRYPFDGDSLTQLLLRINTEAPAPLSAFRQDLPEELQSIVDAMLAKDRAHRFDNCAAAKAALSRFRTLDAPPAIVHSAVPAAAPRRRDEPLSVSAVRPRRASRRPLLIGVLVVLVVIAAALAALLVWARPHSRPTAAHPPSRAAPPPEVPRMAHVRIATTPPDAMLSLDGVPVESPYEHDVALDGRVHTIRVERAGYEPREITGVDFSLQSVVPIVLRALPEPTPPAPVPSPAERPEAPIAHPRPRPIAAPPPIPLPRPPPVRPVQSAPSGQFASPF